MPRLLLVDDEPANVRLLRAMLSRCDFEILEAGDGTSAIASFESERPDLVLLDLRLPDMDGTEVLARMRAIDWHVPVVVITAHTDREHRLRAIEAGADDFLEKPIDRPILLARVRTLLALKASNDELAGRHAAVAALQREQRDLMQLIVHDLRTPLAVAKSGIAYAEQFYASDPQESTLALHDAAEGIHRISDLVDDMLVVARLEQANLPIRKDRLDAQAVIEHAIRPFHRRAQSQRVRIDTPTEPLEVVADRSLMVRVIQNLVDNSLRHTPEAGCVEIATRPADAGAATIAVSNSGPPIPTDVRERLFERMVRGASPGSRPGSFGLGLYFCRRAVEAHGGRIWIGDRHAWPASFMISLPAE